MLALVLLNPKLTASAAEALTVPVMAGALGSAASLDLQRAAGWGLRFKVFIPFQGFRAIRVCWKA